jgi:Ribosomal protein L21E
VPNSNGPLTGTRSKLSNRPRDRGTSPPQRAIQQFDEGQKVHLSIDPSVPDGRFHHRFSGHTGTVVGEQGSSYKVEIVDGGKTKTILAAAAHLAAQGQDE